MAQHDYVIANGTGAAVRSDLNNGLAAIVSNNSGATEPTTMYAYQWWADTTTGLLKIRNSANSAWVTLFELDGTLVASDISLGAGTAGAPSLFFTGDLNTGIYSPGADQVAISTNGTSRIVVDASGNVNIDSNTFYVDAANNRVGLGTSAPSTLLHLSSSSSEYLRIQNTTAGNSVYLGNSAGTGILQVDGANSLKVITNSSDRLVVTSAGNVGIGSTAPQEILEVRKDSAGASVVGALLTNASSNANTAIGISFSPNLGGTTRSASIYGVNETAAQNATALTFFTNANGASGTEKARLDSSGRLLVGTIASPAHQLQVSTDSAGKPSTNTWTIVSDQRIKEDIELANLDLCYEAIKNIPLKRFKWRDEVYTDEQVRDRRKLGWIAQDVEAVFPKAVGTYEFKYNQVFEETIIPAVEEELDADGNVITPAQPERIEKGELISEDVIEDCRDLNADQLYAAMYGAVQKLMAKVETLEASNADLIARVAALEAA